MYRVILFLLALILAQQQATSVKYYPPLPILVSEYTTFIPVNGSEIISSQSIEAFEVSNTKNASLVNVTSTFKLSLYNLSIYSLTSAGEWMHIKSSTRELTCHLFHESNLKKFMIVKFAGGKLNTIATFDESLFRANFKSQRNASAVQTIKDIFRLSDRCLLGSVEDKFYRIYEDNKTVAFIPTIANWTLEAVSPSLRIAISNGAIYEFNFTANTFQQIRTIHNSKKYMIHHSEQQSLFVVTSSNSTSTTVDGKPKFLVDQMVSFYSQSGSTTQYLDNSTISALSDQQLIEPTISRSYSKLFLIYSSRTPNDTKKYVLFKFVDLDNKVYNVEYQNQTDFQEVIAKINNKRYMAIGEKFSVFRDQNCSGNCTQSAFQFNGSKIMRLGMRVISVPQENTNFDKIYVYGPSQDYSLVVIQLKIGTAYNLLKVQYNSLESNKRKLEAPDYQLDISAYVKIQKDEGEFEFTGLKYDPVGNKTSLKMVRLNDIYNDSKLVTEYDIVLDGLNALISTTKNCALVIKDQNVNSIFILELVNNTYQARMFIPENPLDMLKINATLTSSIQLAFTCDKIIIDQKYVLVRVGPAWRLVTNDFATTFTLRTIDRNTLAYAFIDNNTILKYNSTLNQYQAYHNLTQPLFTGEANAVSYLDPATNNTRIGMFSRQIKDGKIKSKTLSLLDKNGSILSVLDIKFEQYLASAGILLEPSEKVDKLLISGLIVKNPFPLVVQIKMDGYDCDFDLLKCSPLQYPRETLRLLQPLDAIISENNYLYVRHRFNIQDILKTKYPPPYKEYIYHLPKGAKPVPIFQRYISPLVNFQWATVKTYGAKDYLIVAAKEQGDKVLTIRKYEVTTEKKAVSAEGMYVQNKVNKSCSVGCLSCSGPNSCLYCKLGYSLDMRSASCYACPAGCVDCNLDKCTKCTKCFIRSYLKQSSCLRCDSTCRDCSGTSTNCTACFPGQLLNKTNGTCSSCLSNCLFCNDTSCLNCRPGFVVNDGTCRSCSILCSTCEANDITKCTNCSIGLTLINSSCEACPQKCLACNSNKTCLRCQLGYLPFSNGSCSMICQLPCLNCNFNKPTECTVCAGQSILNGTKCQMNLTCNSTDSCQACGKGLNLYLMGKSCLNCSKVANISNCSQCNPDKPQNCLQCVKGFYLNSAGQCSSCASNCSSCKNEMSCLQCSQGFTLPEGFELGSCIACKSPCMACSGSAQNCLSCISGFDKKGWKCQNKTFIALKMTFSSDKATTLNNMDLIVDKILQVAKQNKTNRQAVTITSVRTGSTIVEGSVNPSSPSVSVGDISQGLSTTTQIGNLTLVSSTAVQVSQTSTPSSPTDDNKKNNAGLIAGVVIGTLAFLIFMIIIIYKCKKDRTKSGENESGKGIYVGATSSHQMKSDKAAV